MIYQIFPPDGILEASVNLPVSKSIAVRGILLAYLGGNLAVAASLADVCDDTRVLYDTLSRGIPTDGSTVDVGSAGTSMRFLAALIAASEGAYCVLTGTERMCRRPIEPLVDALRSLGAEIGYKGVEGFPPLEIRGKKLSGGAIEIDAGVSSQFISALMFAVPLMAQELKIAFRGAIQSLPYIKMSAEMMKHCGVAADVDRDKAVIAATAYKQASLLVEADWSAAAFWYEVAALSAGWLTLPRLKENSLQGDRAAAALFERLGVITEFADEGAELSATPDLWNNLEADMSDMPDVVPALAVTSAIVGVPFRLSGVAALRDKECDRLQALVDELGKVGIMLTIENYGNTLVWDGTRTPLRQVPIFDTHGDHRIAMALAPISIFVPGIVLRDAEVVSKSYPNFWSDFASAGFILADPRESAQENKEE